MKLILLRHGDYEKNTAEKNLSDRGKSQIAEIGKIINRIVEKNINIYVSPSKRCIETANLLFKSLEEINVKDELNENSNYSMVSDLIDLILKLDKDALVITHKPIISMIIFHLGLPEIEIEPAGFIYLIHENETSIIAVFQPSLFL